MAKKILVSDRVFDWLTHRAGPNKSVALVLQEIIKSVEKYEADLAKYQAWVDASQPQLQDKRGLPYHGEAVS